MKCLNLFVVFTVLFIKVCYTLTCEEAKSIFNMEWDGNCCDLQQITCNEAKDEILSIDIMSLQEESEPQGELFARSPKSSKKFKTKHKHYGNNNNDDDCYVSKVPLSTCLSACDLKTSEDDKKSCQDTCKVNDENSKQCEAICEEVSPLTGKCTEYKEDMSAAFNLKINSLLWGVAIITLLKVLY